MQFNISDKPSLQLQFDSFCLKTSDPTQKKVKKGRELVWNGRQNLIYAQFLDDHKSQMQTQRNRRRNKVFTILGKLLKTRNSDQCRSHHQKMMITHKNIQNISHYLRKKYDTERFNSRDQEIRRENSQIQIETPFSFEVLTGGTEQQLQNESQLEYCNEIQQQQSIWNFFQEGILIKSKKNDKV